MNLNFIQQQQGKHTWYWKPSHLPSASELIDLEEEPTGTSLLNQYNLYLHPKYFFLYPQVNNNVFFNYKN